jgi:hypothetical protein
MMTLFFGIASTFLLFRQLTDPTAYRWWLWGASAFFTLFAHFLIGPALLIAQLSFVVLLLLRERLTYQTAARVGLVTAVALALYITAAAIGAFSTFNRQMYGGGNEVRGSNADNLVFLGQWLVGTYASWPVQLMCAAILSVGALVLLRRLPDFFLYLLLPTVFLVGAFVVGALPFITARYCILAIIPSIVCAAVGAVTIMDALARHFGGRATIVGRVVAISPLVILAICAIQSVATYYSKQRFPFRPVAEYLVANRQTGDQSLFVGYGFDKFHYYDSQLIKDDDFTLIENALRDGRTFWLVYHLPSYLEQLPSDLAQRIRRSVVDEFHYVGFPEQLVTQYEGFVLRLKSH